jgi:hypothetical protein
MITPVPPPKLTPEQETARKRRSLMIALALAAFVALVFLVSMIQLRANVVSQAGGGG